MKDMTLIIAFLIFVAGFLMGTITGKRIETQHATYLEWNCEMYGDENMKRCEPNIYNDCPAYGDLRDDGWCYPH